MKKILLIAPWCSDENDSYSKGLAEGLAKYTELFFFVNYLCKNYSIDCKKYPVFFQISDRLKKKKGFIRKAGRIIRGLEYFWAYVQILKIVKKERIDVVHLQWPLFFAIDFIFLKKIKKLGTRIVFTSHNVIPHTDGSKHVSQLKKLHSLCDKIILHGKSLKGEYLQYFPEDESKICISKHGTFPNVDLACYESNVDEQIKTFVAKDDSLIVSFIGLVFYNKGVDRLLSYWKQNKGTNARLIVAGEVTGPYSELLELCLEENPSVLKIMRHINEDELAYIVSRSDIIALPYRHASMSGVVFTAAKYSKPIVFTDCGAISEYVDESCAVKVKNDEESFNSSLNVLLHKTKETYADMGRNLHEKIFGECNWNDIAQDIVRNIY